MKINAEIRTCILQACKSDHDSWTNGRADEIILNALDHLSDEAKLEICLRYLPGDHLLFKSYGMQKALQMMSDAKVMEYKPAPLRDFTPTMEPRG